MVRLCKSLETDIREMRYAYCDALMEAAGRDSRIVSIDCDLSNSCGTKAFGQAYPERAFNVGIAEQNACAMAGGLSAAGMIPFFHSFSAFATRRVYDQIFLSCAYAQQNVKIIGCDAGISAAYNGGTHMAFGDANIMRVMPQVTVIEPTDAAMMPSLVEQMAKVYGVFYMRMPRKQVPKVYEDGQSFPIGRGVVLREGCDVSIIACGMEVAEALRAAVLLAEEGIEARVVDMFTLKPIDVDCILDCAKRTKAVVTAENGFINGGLGSAVAEILGEFAPIPIKRVGVNDEFGEVGPVDYLRERFGLCAAHIAAAAKAIIANRL